MEVFIERMKDNNFTDDEYEFIYNNKDLFLQVYSIGILDGINI